MTDTNTGTAATGTEAPVDAGVTTQAAPATQPADEVTRLRLAQAGSDRQVTSLQQQLIDATTARDKAITEARELAAGKGDADATLREQLVQRERELAEARTEASAAKLSNAYPETYKLFGQSIAGMAVDVLEASEARLSGAGLVPTTSVPTPVGNNAPRTPNAPKNIEDMTAAELRAHMALTFTTRDANGNLV